MVVGAILHEGQGGPHFTQFFVLFWMGSAVVTLNNKLLGGTISFFQSVTLFLLYFNKSLSRFAFLATVLRLL
jgi:hypothetical protein